MDKLTRRASKWDLLKSIDTSCGEVSDSLNGAADDVIAAIHEIRDLLRAEVREWEDAAQGAENPHPDEEHCACVGPLRATIARLRAEVERLTRELEIERERNASRIFCPKCGANLPCESCEQYQADVERLTGERDRLRQTITEIEELDPGGIGLDAVIRDHQSRAEKAEAALREYGRHQSGCLWRYQECSCGFDAAPYAPEPGEEAD